MSLRPVYFFDWGGDPIWGATAPNREALSRRTRFVSPRIRLNAGLCESCQHARRVDSARGSTFILCRKSETDARFVKYPGLPVWRCEGFAAAAADARQGHQR